MPDITYEPNEGFFRVKCLDSVADEFLDLAKSVLNGIVQREIAVVSPNSRVGYYGASLPISFFDVARRQLADYDDSRLQGVDSVKIADHDWQLMSKTDEVRQMYETVSWPQELAGSSFRETWQLPVESGSSDLTVQDLFGSNDPIDMLQKTTGCVVTKSIDGRAVHLGADTEDNVRLAAKKLDTLLKYYVSSDHINHEGQPEPNLQPSTATSNPGDFLSRSLPREQDRMQSRVAIYRTTEPTPPDYHHP
jgi:hypothetical protein